MKKTVLITGASSGIGAECAIKFAKNGYFVAINYFKSRQLAEKLLKKIRDFGGVAELFYGNVCSESDVEKIFLGVKSRFGLPGVLVNNAGISKQQTFVNTSLADWNQIFAVNVSSMFICCKKFLPNMINNKWGRIINISSIWGLAGASCEVAYSASKAAVVGFSKALAHEMALSSITVNCVAPGVIDTRMNNSLDRSDLNALKDLIPCGRLGSVIDVAEAVFFLASEQSAYITGQVLKVDGGFLR